MRIFSATIDDDIIAKGTQPIFCGHLENALREMGHNAIKFKWNRYFPTKKSWVEWEKKGKHIKNKQLVKEVKKAHEKKKVDLFFSAGDGRYLCAEAIEKIKAFGIPTLNFAPDDVPELLFEKYYRDLVLVYDYNWTVQMGAFKNYKKIGAKFIYVPHGADPNVFRPYNCKREFDVTFIGLNSGYRRKLLQIIVDEGIDLHVWGGRWRRNIWDIVYGIGNDLSFLCNFRDLQDPKERARQVSELFWSDTFWYVKHFDRLKKIFGLKLSFEEIIRMYGRSRISLNFSGTVGTYQKNFNKAIKTIKGRDIEAPMSEAFYLTDYSDEIAQLYKIGKEIETYRSVSELVDKIKYYLENPDEAEAIRKAGRKRALKDYTWTKCFERIFNEIGIS